MRKFAVLFFSFAMAAFAGENVLTIEAAINEALEKNPELNRLRQQVEMKKGEFWLSTSLSDPEISIMKEGVNLNSGNGYAEKRYTITQGFDFPLTSYFRLKRLHNEEQALQNRLTAETFNLKSRVKTGYTRLIFAQEILLLQKQQLKIAQNLYNATRTRYEVGEASVLDLMKTEIQIAEAQNDRDDAAMAFDEARYNLFKVIGMDPDEQTYALSFVDSLVYVPVSINQESILARLETQPELMEFDKMLNAAQSGVREAWSSVLPDFSASYYRQDYGTGYDFYGYEIGINIPLWFFLNQRGHIKKANAEKHAAAWQRKETELAMKHNIEIAWHSYENTRKALERFRSQVRAKALKLRDLTIFGYESGELDMLSLLEAQRTYINNEKRYFTVLKDYYLNIIELEKYMQQEFVFNGKSE